jgi:hypothetical protein
MPPRRCRPHAQRPKPLSTRWAPRPRGLHLRIDALRFRPLPSSDFFLLQVLSSPTVSPVPRVIRS